MRIEGEMKKRGREYGDAQNREKKPDMHNLVLDSSGYFSWASFSLWAKNV